MEYLSRLFTDRESRTDMMNRGKTWSLDCNLVGLQLGASPWLELDEPKRILAQ
jgi:hypothetical protein